MARGAPSRKAPENPREASSSGGRRTVLLIAGFTALMVLAIAVFAALAATTDNFTPNEQGLLPVGSQAPDFEVETVNGGNVSLADARGAGATMLVFFATWCPHCNEEAPILSDLQSEYDDLRIIMLGIDGEDDAEQVREFVDRYGIEGPAAYEPSLGPIYQVSGYPTIYLINRDQEIVAVHSGEAPQNILEGWTEEALASNG